MKNNQYDKLLLTLLDFLRRVEGIKSSFPFVCEEIINKNEELINELISLGQIKESNDKNTRELQFPIEKVEKVESLKHQIEGISRMRMILPRNFLISLVAEYDGYLAKLIHHLYILCPEKLNSSKKTLTYSELLNFSEMENLKNYLIEEEVNLILRESHLEQLKWLGEKIEKSDLFLSNHNLIQQLIEITERRNLFVHNGGIVNHYYIDNCNKNNVLLDTNLATGDQLHVDHIYFCEACDCISKIATFVTYTFLRKFSKGNQHIILETDNFFNTICVEFIKFDNYTLALDLLEFSSKLNNLANDGIRTMMMINKAQCHKWLNQNDKMRNVLNSMDWSSLKKDFQLAKFVLIDDFKSAARLMSLIETDQIGEYEYRSWPLFKEFRKSQDFLRSFQIHFGHEFKTLDTSQKEELEELNLQKYSLSNHLISIIRALYNNGSLKKLSPSEIRDKCGNGAYGNHRKLSFPEWNLVKDDEQTNKRTLTDKGISFAKGEISVNRNLIQNQFTGDFEPADDVMVTIEDYV